MLSPDLQRIEHIRDYCLDIEDMVSRFGNTYEAFCGDVDFQYAISFCVLQIGELSGKLSQEFRNATEKSIRWNLIKGMRNIVAHDYGHISMETLWGVVASDIPALKQFCEEQLSKAGD